MVSDTAENNHGDRQNDDDENPRNDENVEDEVEAVRIFWIWSAGEFCKLSHRYGSQIVEQQLFCFPYLRLLKTVVYWEVQEIVLQLNRNNFNYIFSASKLFIVRAG